MGIARIVMVKLIMVKMMTMIMMMIIFWTNLSPNRVRQPGLFIVNVATKEVLARPLLERFFIIIIIIFIIVVVINVATKEVP